ncbi:MAG: putative secreted protein [Frankiales bacterium]|jgi:hypothetical protein|nr:putative secreted protein [Frankiales bacterium]
MALHPVGPLPPTTYWRRRAALLLGVLVLLLLVRSCAGNDSPSSSAAGSTPTPTPTTSVRPSPARTVAPAVAACSDAVLRLSATTDAPSYPVGTSPKLTLVVTNTSAQPCTRDLGTGAVEVLVFSGQDRIWSSDDCMPGKGKAPTRIEAGGTRAVPLTWAGKRSKPACAGTKAQAQAGTYRLVGRVGTLRADVAVFRIQA